MKESFQKITAWIKAHPIPAAIIGVVVVVIGYFVVKSSGGNPGGSSIDGGALGTAEATPLAGLGGGDSITAPITPAAITAPSPTDSAILSPAYNDITTPAAAASIETFGTPSDYINESSIFSGPTPAAAILNPAQAFNTLAGMGLPLAAANKAPTGNKTVGLVAQNTGQPAQPVSGGGVAAALSKITAPIVAPLTTSIKPVIKPAVIIPAPKPAIGGGVAAALSKITAPIKPVPVASFKPAAAPSFNLYLYTGARAGYTWNAAQKKYIKNGLKAL